MPKTTVVFYREGSEVPVLKWLAKLRKADKRAFAKCRVRIARLAELGNELRRPEADFLRDGIHELRIRKGHVNYRILYSLHSSHIALLSHALTKEATVPPADIERALRCKSAYETDPEAHSYAGDVE